jgi:PadR family transcriptional regulator, regulatory protein PadR
MRTTHALVQTAQALLSDPDGRHWGYAISKMSGVRSGVLYPILARMLKADWATVEWEDDAAAEGRPPRRYYELTDLGRSQLGTLLAEAKVDPRFADLELDRALPALQRPVARRGWFSDIDPEEAPSETHQWQPCLQLDGWCPNFDVWFASKEECDDFIRRDILGQPMLPD